jgi:glycosyltransferase involved in cell wall biosynthesis
MSKSVAIIGTRGYPSYYGGFETAVRRLAPYLVDKGWDVTVYGRNGTTHPEDPNRDPRVRTVVTRGLETKSLSTLSHGLTAAMHVAKAKPDVTLVMNAANGYFLPILKARGIPTLVNVDGIEWDRAKWGRLAKSMFHNGARWTARFGTRMVYDSLEIARRWKEEFKLSGAFIPYGGEVPAPSEVERGLPDRGYVLMVARFVPENTVPEFLEAAKALSDSWPIVIVGSSGYGGDLDDQVRALAERSDNVHWLGHVSDDDRLHRLWQHAGAYFHGHSVGGTNPALVQAMACGAPIVARDTVYNREVLKDGAWFVPPTVEGIERSISQLMGKPDEMERLGEMAKARAIDTYSWDSVCAVYEAELSALANR